jgi:hypothetical protein
MEISTIDFGKREAFLNVAPSRLGRGVYGSSQPESDTCIMGRGVCGSSQPESETSLDNTQNGVYQEADAFNHITQEEILAENEKIIRQEKIKQYAPYVLSGLIVLVGVMLILKPKK